MKTIALTLFFICLLTSCKDDTDDLEQLTFSDFQTSLKVDMNYNDIVTTFGEPEKDIGSGIHIYVYTLADTTEIWIGYVDKIIYAKHVDHDGNILQTFIE